MASREGTRQARLCVCVENSTPILSQPCVELFALRAAFPPAQHPRSLQLLQRKCGTFFLLRNAPETCFSSACLLRRRHTHCISQSSQGTELCTLFLSLTTLPPYLVPYALLARHGTEGRGDEGDEKPVRSSLAVHTDDPMKSTESSTYIRTYTSILLCSSVESSMPK